MPVAGRKPNPDREAVVTRHKPIDFDEVPNVPFEGAPPLRTRATGGVSVMAVGAANSEDWPEATRGWWAAVSRMPHAVKWDDAMWQLAMDAAEVHARTMEAWRGYTGSQLLAYCKQLGTTADYRRDLRIRYVEPKNAPQRAPGEADENVVELNAYRDL
jgi:hypothetical protein